MKKNIGFIAILLLMAGFGNAQSNENGQRQLPKPPTVEEQLKRVTAELNKHPDLTTAQKEKVLDAYKTFFTEIEKESKNGKPLPPPPPPPPVSREVAEKLSKERDAKIKEVLTDEQYKKYVEIEKSMRPKRPCDEVPPKESND
jgi:hypothetical protein